MRLNESEETFTVMYAVYKAQYPLTDIQIMDATEVAGIDYFTLHQIIDNLLSGRQLIEAKTPTGSAYLLSPTGKDALLHFYRSIRLSVRNYIDDYLQQNTDDIINGNENVGAAYNDSDGSSLVILKTFENGKCIVELCLRADNCQQAQELINAWRKNAPLVYNGIINNLTVQ